MIVKVVLTGGANRKHYFLLFSKLLFTKSYQPSVCFSSIPPHAEVPLNTETKPIIPYFSTLLSYLHNPLLSMDEYNILIFLRLLAYYLPYCIL